jgi:Sulfotransferase family
VVGPHGIQPDSLPILFVCGLHRGGTSALTRLLSSSAGVRGMTGTGVFEDEGQHLQRVYLPASAHGGPGLFAFDRGAHLTERSGLANRSNAAELVRAWAPYWHLDTGDTLGWPPDGDLVVLEKSPPNLVRTRFLQALFPSARFIVLVRHPAVVTVSTARWRPGLAPGTLLRHWLHAHRRYRKDARKLEHVSELRYEDLLADPGTALGTVAGQLKVTGPFDLTILETGHNDRHLLTWRALADQLSSDDTAAIEKGIRQYGYSLHEPYVLPLDGAAG